LQEFSHFLVSYPLAYPLPELLAAAPAGAICKMY
jgi:hypothetical protein